MGRCTISFENANIVQHKGADGHLDVDFFGIVWTIDDQTLSRSYPLGDRSTGINLLADGSLLRNIVDSIDCPDGATVTATVIVINVSAIAVDQQVAVAANFMRDAAEEIGKLYLQVGSQVLGMAADLGAPALATAIATAAAPIIASLAGELAKAIGALFDNVLTPALEAAISAVVSLISGVTNCNGEVLHEAFVFVPNTSRDDVFSRTYQGASGKDGCHVPVTNVRWWAHRDVAVSYTPLNSTTVPGLIYGLSPRTVHTPSDNPVSDDHQTWDLLWYNHLGFQDGSAAWQGPRIVGTEWEFQQVAPGIDGTLYAVDKSGVMHWYRNTGYRTGMNLWAGPVSIGSGWSIPASNPGPGDFLGILCDPRPDSLVPVEGPGFVPKTQVIYAVKADGSLWWYRHEQPVSGQPVWANNGTGSPIGTGWTGGYRRLFAGGNGILYLIADDGVLYWYQHTGFETGAATFAPRKAVGSAWESYIDAFSVGGGVIYGIAANGDLFWYRHVDQASGGTTWQGPLHVGSGWNTGGVSVVANSVNLKFSAVH